MQEWAEWFYNSTKWKKCRTAYKKARHYICEDCGGLGEIVHHKTPLTQGNIHNPLVALSFGNLRLVCRKCHAQYNESGAFKAVTAEGVRFDASGNLIAIPPASHERELIV